MAIDVSELLTDEDFCTTFTVEKESTPVWKAGRLTAEKERFTVTGIVLPSSSEDIELLEEGDRRQGLKSFYTNEVPLSVSNTETRSDIILWKGQRYKLLHAFDYSLNGYYKAIGSRIGEV